MKHTQGIMDVEYDGSLGLGGQMMMNVAPDHAGHDEVRANHERIMALWNAADGMPTEEAVKYITHGREMAAYIKLDCATCEYNGDSCKADHCATKTLLTKLKVK